MREIDAKVRFVRSPIANSPNGRSTSCAFPCTYYHIYNYTYIVKLEGTTTLPTSLRLTTTMEAFATWFMVLFQQASDRQNRKLQAEGRFSFTKLSGTIHCARATASTGILSRTRRSSFLRRHHASLATPHCLATSCTGHTDDETPRRTSSHRTWTFMTTPVIKTRSRTTNHRPQE